MWLVICDRVQYNTPKNKYAHNFFFFTFQKKHFTYTVGPLDANAF